MEDRVQGTFVSQKVSKVRWKPETGYDSQYFVTGSCDNETENRVALWSCPSDRSDDKDEPNQLCKREVDGDVTELQFVQNNDFLVSTSSGTVQLLTIIGAGDAANTNFKPKISWEKLHPFKTGELSSCTGLATFMGEVATIGENGSIVSLNLEKKQPLRIIESADSCSLRCVLYRRHNEILTGNLRGQMKLWDLRIADEKPLLTFMLSGDQLGATCITQHPTQQHTVLVGGEDGSITVWDLRETSFAVPLAAHSGLVSEMVFHPDRPNHLFSCSSSGEAWHWDTSSVSRPARPGQSMPWTNAGPDPLQNENPWLNTDAVKHRLHIVSLMQTLHKGINSVDVNKDKAVIGCDNEAVYVISDVLNSRM